MKQPICMGISGGTASGKSTWCGQVEQHLTRKGWRVRVFHMDDYYKPEEERPSMRSPYSGTEYRDDNVPEALDMDRIRRDWEQALGEKDSWDLVIMEGVFSLRYPWVLDHLDLKIYVDCSDDRRLARRITRHLSYGQEYDEIVSRYLEAVRPRHKELIEPVKWKADFIVNGEYFSPLSLEILEKWLEAKKNQ